MAFISLKEFFARMGLVTPAQFDEHAKAWRVAADNGAQGFNILCTADKREGDVVDVGFQDKGEVAAVFYGERRDA